MLATGATAVVLLTVLLGALLLFTHQISRSVDLALQGRASDLQAAISAGGLPSVRTEELAEVYDQRGAVLASSGTIRVGVPLLAAPSAITCPGRDRYVTPTLRLANSTRTRPVRVLARCLSHGEVLAVGVPVEQRQDAQDRLVLLLVIVAPLLLGGVALTLWRAVRAALRPVDDLTRQAQGVRAGQDTELTLPRGRRQDEISRLGHTLQEMLDRLSVAFARESAFVDDASHELRTPLAVLRGEIELALSDLGDQAGVEQSLRVALAEAERLSRLAEDLLELARQRTGPASQLEQDIALSDFLHRFAERIQRPHPLSVEVRCPDDLVLRSDPDRLDRILTNLVANAADAHASSVLLEASASDDELLTAPHIDLDVQDDGPGFPLEFLPSAFERFTRADAARTRTTGAGLGLALVQALVTNLGGTVAADNASELGGAAVRIHLPTAALPPQSES